jgi:hypothetical protein
LSDLGQVATVLESIAEMRSQAYAKTKHSLIVWLAFGLTGVFLAVAFGSAIYALTVMNMSMDSNDGWSDARGDLSLVICSRTSPLCEEQTSLRPHLRLRRRRRYVP